MTDPLGNSTRREYDLYGRVTREINAKGYITQYEYNSYGYLTKIIDPMGRQKWTPKIGQQIREIKM